MSNEQLLPQCDSCKAERDDCISIPINLTSHLMYPEDAELTELVVDVCADCIARATRSEIPGGKS